MNPSHIKLVARAVMTTALLHDFVVSARNKRVNRNLLEENAKIEKINDVLLDELHKTQSQVDYLLKKLDEHDIEASEFDLIVFNSLIS